jgi:chitodextrinase
LAWTASTDNVGIAQYRIERCQGAGCSNFVQVLTSTGTSISNTGLTNGTNYSYRVLAVDAASNPSTYSNVASVSTLDTAAPTAPSSLTATAAAARRSIWLDSIDRQRRRRAISRNVARVWLYYFHLAHANRE